MTKEQKKTLEKHITEKIDSLKEDVASYKELTKPIPPDSSIGRLTRMEAINSKSINEAALRAAKHTLSKLQRALRMIDDPDFGSCKECEEPIPFGRLMNMPEADLCVQCAEKMGA